MRRAHRPLTLAMSTLTAPVAGLALQTSEHSAFTPTNSKSSPAAAPDPPPSSPEMEADDKCRSPGVSVSPCSSVFSRSLAAHRSSSGTTHHSSLNSSSSGTVSSSHSTRSPSPPSSPDSPSKWSEHRHRRARGSSPERPGSGKENDGAVVPHNPPSGQQRFTSFSVVDILAQPSKKRTPPPSPSPPPQPAHSPTTTAATTTGVPMRVGLGVGVGVGMSGVNALTDTRWSGNQSQHAGLPSWYLGAPRFSATTSKYSKISNYAMRFNCS